MSTTTIIDTDGLIGLFGLGLGAVGIGVGVAGYGVSLAIELGTEIAEGIRAAAQLKKDYDKEILKIEEETEKALKRAEEKYEYSIAQTKDEHNRRVLERENERLKKRQNKYKAILSDAKRMCIQILKELDTIGNEYLADLSNYFDDKINYTEFARLKNDARKEISKEANLIIQECEITEDSELESKANSLKEKTLIIKQKFENLLTAVNSLGRAEEIYKIDLEKYKLFTSDLTDKITDTIKYFTIIDEPAGPDDNALKEIKYANDIFAYYINGEGTLYLKPTSVETIKKIYSDNNCNTENIRDFNNLSGVTKANKRFKATKKRKIDNEIFSNKNRLRELTEEYTEIYGSLYGNYADALNLTKFPTIDEKIKALETEIEALRDKYNDYVRQKLMDAYFESALRKSSRGVIKIGEIQTRAGNYKSLYQIGKDGTSLQVYTDAQGSVMIEAGAVYDDNKDKKSISDKCLRVIESNNEKFCRSILPDLIGQLKNELENAGAKNINVDIKELDASIIHWFSLKDYSIKPEKVYSIDHLGNIKGGRKREKSEQKYMRSENDT